jgi:tripartite motif-containing protein 71
MVKLSPSGATLARWGGPGKEAGQFERLEGVAVDPAGRVYAADAANGRLQRFAAPGQVDRVWASQFGCARVSIPCQVIPQDATFSGSIAVGVDGAGSVYVVDGSQGIKRFAPAGPLAGKWGTPNSSEPGGFRQSDGIAIDAQGNIFVADTLNNRVQKFAPDGAPVAQWGSKDGVLRLNHPAGVAVDGAGTVYIADTDNQRVVALSPEGQVVRQWGACARTGDGGACLSTRLGNAPGEFAQPHHLVANARGELLVADRANNRVQVLKAYPVWEQVTPPAPAPAVPPAT